MWMEFRGILDGILGIWSTRLTIDDLGGRPAVAADAFKACASGVLHYAVKEHNLTQPDHLLCFFSPLRNLSHSSKMRDFVEESDNLLRREHGQISC